MEGNADGYSVVMFLVSFGDGGSNVIFFFGEGRRVFFLVG